MADKAKEQHNNILLAVAGFAAVVAIVALIGFLALGRDPEVIQGEMEVEEYRVSGKVPGRILELRVKEGDLVKAGHYRGSRSGGKDGTGTECCRCRFGYRSDGTERCP